MDHAKTEGAPDDRLDRSMAPRQAPETIESDSQLKGRDGQAEVAPDEQGSLAARREAARQHGDVFVVASDLEDADQREAAPGSREQD